MSEEKFCRQIVDDLSEYADGGLAPPRRQEIDMHLSRCADCVGAQKRLSQMLTMIHALPRREPTLDLWMEMAPKVAQIRAEERLGLAQRWRLRVGRFLSNIAAGSILYTQAVALNTEARMRKYLIQDPFIAGEEA